MRNRTLLFIAALIFFNLSTNAQITNSSFEVWEVDTTNFGGFSPYLPPSTFTYSDPTGWTSSNSISAQPALGGYSLVTQSNDAAFGSSAVQMITDTLAKVAGSQLTLPGFLLNGKYQINLTSLVLGTNITPLSVQGAGQPFTKRLGAFKGYYKYSPVFNPNTGGNDTCLMWAVLRKGNKLIADAIFKSTDSTGTYQSFSVDFNYVSCEVPDTLVILLSSSIPNIPTLFGGHSNLVPGSMLLVDSISYDTLSPDYRFTPFARNDFDTTNKGVGLNIAVEGNDEDCDNQLSSLTLAVISQPVNGTAVVQNGNSVLYTPSPQFIGTDTFSYTLYDGSNTSIPALVSVVVKGNTPVNEVPQVQVTLYPVPTTNELNIRFDNPGKSIARVYDVIGNLIGTFAMNSNDNRIPVSALSNGIYNLQIINESSAVIAHTQFVVSK